MLFDHCAECKRCCVVDPGYPPLEVSLTNAETQKLASICIETACPHLGSNGCTLGPSKPLSCSLYPLSYNPKRKVFSIDQECPISSEYGEQLKDPMSDASAHLSEMKERIRQLNKEDQKFLRDNHKVDVSYFDLKKLPIRASLQEL